MIVNWMLQSRMAAKMHFATTENGRGKPSVRRAIGRLLESPLTPEYQMRSGTAPIGSTLLNAPTEVLCKFARTDHAAKKVAQPPLRQGDRSTVNLGQIRPSAATWGMPGRAKLFRLGKSTNLLHTIFFLRLSPARSSMIILI